MTNTLNWRPLQAIARERLSNARLKAHFGAQWLARAARANIKPRDDDSHANFGWDETCRGLATHPLRDGRRLALQLPDLTISLIDTASTSLASLHLEGLTEPQVGERLASMLAAFDLKLDPLATSLPYAMPDCPWAAGAAYRPAEYAAELAELSAWFGNANISLEGLRDATLAHGHAAQTPRCWPHHFDLAVLTAFPVRGAEGTAYVGAGLSPGDHYYDEPYFYVSIYPRPKTGALPPLPAGARWREEDFFAAVAVASAILACDQPQAETEAYLAEAIEFGFRAFG